MNPIGMFRTRRLDQQRSSYGFVIGLVFAFALTGWLWFLFASGFWDAQNYEINELTTLDRGEVVREMEKIMGDGPRRPWHRNNLLMLDVKKFSETLKERLFVDEVTVDKSYPDVLRLLIKERQRSVVLVSGEQYVNVDAAGIVTGEAEGETLVAARDCVAAKSFADEIHLPVIIMQTADPLSAGFQIAKPENVRRWLDVSRALVLGGVKTRFMKIEAPESSLGRFVSERGYDIYIDLDESIDRQIATYVGFMRTKPDENKITEYLDIRVAGKVFVK